jgi:SpoVK/Ycf46/Vps4 family AAA+-type ATPase
VRDIFVKARLVMPCVIFIDELDGMCGHRGAGGVADRVISQFLTELDGMPDALAKAKSSIVIVAATNRPDNIDPAVLRPGRIDRKVYVGLPELAERVAIAAIGLRKMPLGVNVSAEGIAARTVGYSGAEIVALCKEAALQAINESTEAERIEERHVDVAVRKVTPRITPADIAWYLSWRGGRQSSMTPFPAHIASSHPPAVKA